MTQGSIDTAVETAAMLRLKERAIKKAFRKYGYIYPCGSRTRLVDCFTLERDAVCFWFNSPDLSTRVVLEPYPPDAEGSREVSGRNP